MIASDDTQHTRLIDQHVANDYELGFRGPRGKLKNAGGYRVQFRTERKPEKVFWTKVVGDTGERSPLGILPGGRKRALTRRYPAFTRTSCSSYERVVRASNNVNRTEFGAQPRTMDCALA